MSEAETVDVSWRDGWEPVSVEDALKSFTGFDEIAIAAMFRKEFTDLSATATARATLFVLLRRKGLDDKDAFRACMRLTLGELDGLFAKADAPQATDATDVDGFLAQARPEA